MIQKHVNKSHKLHGLHRKIIKTPSVTLPFVLYPNLIRILYTDPIEFDHSCPSNTSNRTDNICRRSLNIQGPNPCWLKTNTHAHDHFEIHKLHSTTLIGRQRYTNRSCLRLRQSGEYRYVRAKRVHRERQRPYSERYFSVLYLCLFVYLRKICYTIGCAFWRKLLLVCYIERRQHQCC